MTGWGQGAVRVSTIGGARTLDAWVDDSGHFAVHPTLGREDGGVWTLTHVPTGLTLGALYASQAAAVAAAANLATVRVDWSRSDVEAWRGTGARSRAAIRRAVASGSIGVAS